MFHLGTGSGGTHISRGETAGVRGYFVDDFPLTTGIFAYKLVTGGSD